MELLKLPTLSGSILQGFWASETESKQINSTGSTMLADVLELNEEPPEKPKGWLLISPLSGKRMSSTDANIFA